MRLLTSLIALSFAALVFATGTAFGSNQVETNASVKRAICNVFGPRYCKQALNVAWCESRYRTWARNGQYLGIFQMGYSERRRFGHGTTAYAQARAAHRYFVLTGRDWSPWSCKPWYAS